eukprot:57634-Amphidinium_carterae.1
MPENQKLYERNQEQKYEAIWVGRDTTTGQHITLTTEFGRQLARKILRLPKEQQFDKTLLLNVTWTEGEYDNSRKKTVKGKQPIPPRLYDLKSPALPYTRSKTTTIPDWHFKPPDQQILDAPPRVPKFPTFTKKQDTTIQPPLGWQQPVDTTPEPITTPQQPILPTAKPTTETTTTTQAQTTPQQQQPVRRRITTKTTLAKNDSFDTGVLLLTTNEDAEEKKLSLDNMHLQE